MSIKQKLVLSSFLLRAQGLTHTVGGKITELDSRVPMPGVSVVLVAANAFLNGSTNEQGDFRIKMFKAPARMVSGYAGVTGDASANSEKVFSYLC